MLIFSGTGAVRGANQVPTPAIVPDNVAQKLQALVDTIRDDGLPGGVIVRVESLKTGAVWEGSSGPFAEEDAQSGIHVADSFRVASITKAFTAAVIWRLAEDKKISVDDLIGKYLDPYVISHIDRLGGVSYGEQISIRELLCHCSGLWDYAVENKDWMRDVFAHPNHQWEPKDLIDIAIKDGKPYFKPGESFHYSDTNYILLGQIIEKVTGKSLAQVYREQVYEPLQLHDTYLEGREPAVGDHPRSHNYVGYLDETTYNPTMDAYASGGQVSTSQDLAKFIAGVMSGRFFKSPDTLKAAMALPILKNLANAESDEGGKFRTHYLFYSFERDGLYFIGHSGFWGGVMFYQPDRQIVITGTGNQVDRHLPLSAIVRAFSDQ